MEKFKRLDWMYAVEIDCRLFYSDIISPFSGNTLVVGGTTSVTIALTWGGVFAPWSSAKVLTPLIVGLVVLILFLWWEARCALHPLVNIPLPDADRNLKHSALQVPFSLMDNRTSLSGWVGVS